jgi:hypothetical protein
VKLLFLKATGGQLGMQLLHKSQPESHVWVRALFNWWQHFAAGKGLEGWLKVFEELCNIIEDPLHTLLLSCCCCWCCLERCKAGSHAGACGPI